MSIHENIARIRERIEHAARRAGRDPAQVTLMAVTKTVSPGRIAEAYAAGLRRFGENRVQEFAAKRNALGNLAGAEFRLIGHLQSNKAAAACEIFAAVESLDSLRLAERLNIAAQKLNQPLPVLIEINIAGEAAKSGLPPDSAELGELLRAAPRLPQLEFRGLMAIPPFSENPEDSRPHFRRLRQLRQRIAALKLPAVTLAELSIGMSHDFEVAIAEGATEVRVGTAIFGERRRKLTIED